MTFAGAVFAYRGNRPGLAAPLAGGVLLLSATAAAACEPPSLAAPAVVAVAAPSAFELVLADGRRLVIAGIGLPSADAAARERLRRNLAERAIDRPLLVVPTGAAADRYGRLPARVYVDIGGPPSDVAAGLVADGEALATGDGLPASCIAALRLAERTAAAAERGRWAGGEFRVESAHDPSLAGRAGRYAVVAGRVISVGQAGRTWYLNFGRRWTLDFTVMIAESDAAALAPSGLHPEALPGTRVRVRGWLEAKDGALIRLAAPGDIERDAD